MYPFRPLVLLAVSFAAVFSYEFNSHPRDLPHQAQFKHRTIPREIGELPRRELFHNEPARPISREVNHQSSEEDVSKEAGVKHALSPRIGEIRNRELFQEQSPIQFAPREAFPVPPPVHSQASSNNGASGTSAGPSGNLPGGHSKASSPDPKVVAAIRECKLHSSSVTQKHGRLSRRTETDLLDTDDVIIVDTDKWGVFMPWTSASLGIGAKQLCGSTAFMIVGYRGAFVSELAPGYFDQVRLYARDMFNQIHFHQGNGNLEGARAVLVSPARGEEPVSVEFNSDMEQNMRNLGIPFISAHYQFEPPHDSSGRFRTIILKGPPPTVHVEDRQISLAPLWHGVPNGAVDEWAQSLP